MFINNYKYQNLEEIIYKLKTNNIFKIEFNLLISLDVHYYEGTKLFSLLDSIKETMKKLINNGIEINTFKINLGDILNRHNIYYKLVVNHLTHKKLKNEKTEIDVVVLKKLEQQSFIESKKQGIEWFKRNIESINLLIPQNKKISSNFELNDNINTLYQGNEDNPKIELISYNHWLNHKDYDSTCNALQNLCLIENNVIKRAFQCELDFYTNRHKKSINLELIKKQSYKYLLDETISYILIHREQNNIIDLYFSMAEPRTTLTFRGRKAQNNPIIKEMMTTGDLRGADQRKYVSIKLVED